LDSTVNFKAGARGAENSWGVEEYANLRLRAGVGEKGTIFGAFNLIASAGNFAASAAALGQVMGPAYSPYVIGDNYAAAMELERLYFRVNGDYLDVEAGLMRLAFGYGLVWGSSDFLNPRNPLFPDARPRGVLGASFSFYPADDLKLRLFGAAPKNPLEAEGGGIVPGFSIDRHWDRLSVQGLYAFATPPAGSDQGLHRIGLSLKADLELGFVADALYTLNPGEPGGIDGLSAGAGFDYSFFDGDLYVLFEYLYNGASSATAGVSAGFRQHYLFGSAAWRIDDYTKLSLSNIFCFDDRSFVPTLSLGYDVFQGFTLSLSGSVYLDRSVFSGGGAGELGPENRRAGSDIRLKAGLRF
jgi:hypothetical protein